MKGRNKSYFLQVMWLCMYEGRILFSDKFLELVGEFGNDAKCKVNIDKKAMVFLYSKYQMIRKKQKCQ